MATAPAEHPNGKAGALMCTSMTDLGGIEELKKVRKVLGVSFGLYSPSHGAITEGSYFRQAWNVIITFFLIYMGTYFVYRLCFVEFRLETPDEFLTWDNSTQTYRDYVREAEEQPFIGPFSGIFDFTLNAVFWVDLFVNFLFSYRDDSNREVINVKQTACHYLRGSFLINFVACIPPEVVEFLSQSLPSTTNQGLRLARLQRVSRIARLMRVTRLAKITSYSKRLTQWFEKHRGARVVTLFVVFVWLVHLLACGWYLCAALHEDPKSTWVFRRSVDNDGTPLMTRGSREQWFHSMYFVVTVFTTVGFGDMSATTIGEIMYVCCLMVIGVVYHSIIISEVINVVTSNDYASEFMLKKRDLIDSFSEHTELSEATRKDMTEWICINAKHMVGDDYSKSDVKKLITGKFMPQSLLNTVPASLFQGELVKNSFLQLCNRVCNMPPRLPILLSLALVKVEYTAEEVVYQTGDFPFNIFLVYSGVFAYCAKRGEEDSLQPYKLFPRGSYFGDLECIEGGPRRTFARCESRKASVLALSGEDMKELMSQFVRFGGIWRRAAVNRETSRIKKLAAMPDGVHYKDIAASTIQNWWLPKTAMMSHKLRSAATRDFQERRPPVRGAHTIMPELFADLDRRVTRKVDGLADNVASMTAKLDFLTSQVSALLANSGGGGRSDTTSMGPPSLRSQARSESPSQPQTQTQSLPPRPGTQQQLQQQQLQQQQQQLQQQHLQKLQLQQPQSEACTPTRSQPQPYRRRHGQEQMKKWRSQDFMSNSLSSLKSSQKFILPQGAPKFPDAPKPPGWEQPILPGMMARVPSTEDTSDLLNSTAS